MVFPLNPGASISRWPGNGHAAPKEGETCLLTLDTKGVLSQKQTDVNMAWFLIYMLYFSFLFLCNTSLRNSMHYFSSFLKTCWYIIEEICGIKGKNVDFERCWQRTIRESLFSAVWSPCFPGSSRRPCKEDDGPTRQREPWHESLSVNWFFWSEPIL